MSRIYFSLHEANEFVKKVSKEIERAVQLKEELELLDNTKIVPDEKHTENLLFEVELNKSFHEKNLELYTLLGYLIRQGCIIRNLEDFEVDFYSRLKDREIFFCWKPREEKIGYWHESNENCLKRKPIAHIESHYLMELERLK